MTEVRTPGVPLADQWVELSPRRRVALYTMATLVVGVAALTAFIAWEAAHGAPRPSGLLLTGAVLVLGALGCVIVWRLIHARAVPVPAMSGWALLALPVVALAASVAESGTVQRPLGVGLEGLVIGLVVLILGAQGQGPGLWSLGFTAAGLLVTFWVQDGAADWRSIVSVAVAAYVVTVSTTWVYRMVTELDESRTELAALRVAEERLRFSRDVHDVVGRALSVIAVKSQLAAALARRGDARAVDEMTAVGDLADEAMGDARRLARGYRAVDLGQEIDGARSLLEHAGVRVVTDAEVADVPQRHREAMAWVVREAVTNILRHADAEQVSIEVSAYRVRVGNDGVRSAGTGPDGGSGLQALTERLRDAGGVLTVDRDPARFSVQATFEEEAR